MIVKQKSSRLVLIAVNTTKALDFKEYSREYIASVTSCIVFTFIDVIIVLGIAKCVSMAMIRDHRLK